MTVTFKDQAEAFLKSAETKKNNPLRPNSLRTYRSQIETHLIPALGHLPLEQVGNKAVKALVEDMAAKHSPATIQLNFTIIKKIRKSAVSEDGDILFPYEWNTEFIDLPSAMSETSKVDAQMITDAISQAVMPQKALFAILAGTGLRISESLALKLGPDDQIGSFWLPTQAKLIIRQQRSGNSFGPTKTGAGFREIDIAPELNNFLIEVFSVTDGLLFKDHENTYRKKLKQAGIEGGFHALRRFRTTHLNKMNCPTGLEYFWMGHAAKDVHGSYVNFGKEIETRKTEAARIGIGFSLEAK